MSEYIIATDKYDYAIFLPYLREEIVRCRDCEHYTYADKEHGNDDWCGKHEHIAWSVNGFCAWGERE